jgi:hypothetical protein
MIVAVTNHAVDRFLERVEGAKGFERESVRIRIREIVELGFSEGAVRPHPYEEDRRIVPFKSGDSILYLSIGPNTTNYRDAEVAVISVLFEHEITAGKIGLGTKIEDSNPGIHFLVARHPPPYAVFVGEDPTIEVYRLKTETALEELRRKKTGQIIDVYQLSER